MPQADNAREDLDRFTTMQQTEATLHWQRNSYFLLASSILLVAASQFKSPAILVSIGLSGFALDLLWLLIQYRSSQYILYWKSEAQKLRASGVPDIYPQQLKGVEMRKVASVLPIPFFLIWTVLILSGVIAYCIG